MKRSRQSRATEKSSAYSTDCTVLPASKPVEGQDVPFSSDWIAKERRALRTLAERLSKQLRIRTTIDALDICRKHLVQDLKALSKQPEPRTGIEIPPRHLRISDIRPSDSHLLEFDGKTKKSWEYMCMELDRFFRHNESYFINDERKLFTAFFRLPHELRLAWGHIKKDEQPKLTYQYFVEWTKSWTDAR